jgi:predicted DNA-binding transcriptional regulator YafY
MKIDRLLGITIYLLNHKRTSAQVMAEQFEVSTRTIVRDIDTLCLAGIPVTAIYGSEGGYELTDTFKMERQIAGQTDYSFIVSALQGLASAYSNKELNATLEKIQSLSSGIQSNVLLDFGVVHENRDTNEFLELLNQAIRLGHTVKFRYTNAENESKDFDVEPVATMYKWYNWYLLCYYPKYEDYCVFKLVRMDEVKITERENKKIHNLDVAKKRWEESEDKRKVINIKLFCKACIKPKCKEYLNGITLEEYENGDFIYQITVPENEQFWFATILSFGDAVKVVEPMEVVNKIKETCQKILDQYDHV